MVPADANLDRGNNRVHITTKKERYAQDMNFTA